MDSLCAKSLYCLSSRRQLKWPWCNAGPSAPSCSIGPGLLLLLHDAFSFLPQAWRASTAEWWWWPTYLEGSGDDLDRGATASHRCRRRHSHQEIPAAVRMKLQQHPWVNCQGLSLKWLPSETMLGIVLHSMVRISILRQFPWILEILIFEEKSSYKRKINIT